MSRGKPNDTSETLDEWGRRAARETGYDAGNLRSLCKRVKKITIIKTTAARWAREARVPGMKLHINTRKPAQPWGRTSAGHTVTQQPAQAGRNLYTITSPAWDHPVLFEVAGFLRAVMTLERHLGPLVLYVDGVYVDDEDPEADMYDDEGLEPLPLNMPGRVAA